jgi:hypothetical protein
MLALRKDESLVHLASRVVIATVVKVPVPRTLGRNVLDVEFQIERSFKGGAARGLLKLPVPYHVGPGSILPSFNFPRFSPGERYAIFLSPRDVPLEFVHLRGLAVAQVDSLEAITDLRPLLPPSRTGHRDSSFGRVPVGVVCATYPVSVQVRHEAHLTLDTVPNGLDPRECHEEFGAAGAMWNGIANVVVFVGPHGRFPMSFTEELPLHGSGLAVTDWQIDRSGVIVDARITLYRANETGPIPWSLTPRPGCFDLRSTVAHEIGHLLGLRHSSTIGDLMEGSAARKGVRRAMTESDRARLRGSYPFGRGMSPEVVEQASRSLQQLAVELRRGDQLMREALHTGTDGIEVVAKGAAAEQSEAPAPRRARSSRARR